MSHRHTDQYHFSLVPTISKIFEKLLLKKLNFSVPPHPVTPEEKNLFIFFFTYPLPWQDCGQTRLQVHERWHRQSVADLEFYFGGGWPRENFVKGFSYNVATKAVVGQFVRCFMELKRVFHIKGFQAVLFTNLLMKYIKVNKRQIKM